MYVCMYIHVHPAIGFHGSVGPETLRFVQCPRRESSDPGSQAQGQRLKPEKTWKTFRKGYKSLSL